VATTPSTIAVDAAEAGKPIVVIAGALQSLAPFGGLTHIRAGDPWAPALDAAIAAPLAGQAQFLARARSPRENTAQFIVESMIDPADARLSVKAIA
jgi:hypothetical protein